MKAAIDIVNNPRYQSLLMQHVKFDSPEFIQNPDEVKSEFLFNDSDPDSIAHDNTVLNSYAFLSTGQGVFALYSPPNTPGQTRIIFIDDESQIQIVGSTPIDFVINLDYLILDYEIHDLECFLALSRAEFGDIGSLTDFISLNR